MAGAGVSTRVAWAGRAVSAIPIFIMGLAGSMKLMGGPQMAAGWAAFGYPPMALRPIAVAELACALLYLIPRTSVLGAVLVTGYLGGAVATHVRLWQPVWPAPALLGVLAWLGLWLRDPRLQELLPLRRTRSRA